MLFFLLFVCAVGFSATWISARRAVQRDLVMQADMQEIKTALQSLSGSLREANVQHVTREGALIERATQGSAKLAEEFVPKLEQLEAQIGKQKLSAEQITSRLAAPLSQILERLARLEQATSQPHSDRAAPKPSSAGARAPSASPPAGMVQVTFRFEPVAHGSRGPADAAELFWLDKAGHELKYTKIPHGLRVVETTKPGDCWRARDAETGAVLLDKYCATLLPAQDVVIK